MNLIETITQHHALIASLAKMRVEQQKREDSPSFIAHDFKSTAPAEQHERFAVLRLPSNQTIARASSWQEACALADALNEAEAARFRVTADAIEAKLRAAIITATIGEPSL